MWSIWKILDIEMLLIKVVSARDPFLLKSCETYNILKFKSEKRKGVGEIENGLNPCVGQI